VIHDYTIEDCLRIDTSIFLNDLKPNRLNNKSKTLSWKSGFALKYEVLSEGIILDYVKNGHNFNVAIVSHKLVQPKGGYRRVFACPFFNCASKCRVLYMPPGAQIFGCRKCHNLTYLSCRDSHKFDSLLGCLGIGTITELKLLLKLRALNTQSNKENPIAAIREKLKIINKLENIKQKRDSRYAE
jgi:hypothetical protein